MIDQSSVASPRSRFIPPWKTLEEIMKKIITSMAISLLFAVTANADVIHFNDYESSGANQGTGFGIVPDSMDFADGGGDFVGQAGLGLSSDNNNSGSFAYVIDGGNTAANGNGWGGNWSGIDSTSGITSGGFGVEADVVAAGVGSYINYTEGATFTISVMVATDGTDPASGGVVAAPRLEFKDAGGAELFRNDDGAPLDASTLTEQYQMMSWSYSLTAADEALGIASVTAVIGTDGLGFGTADGLVYFDDVLFEVNSENVVTLAVPEPATASLMLAGLLGLCGVRRRKN